MVIMAQPPSLHDPSLCTMCHALTPLTTNLKPYTDWTPCRVRHDGVDLWLPLGQWSLGSPVGHQWKMKLGDSMLRNICDAINQNDGWEEKKKWYCYVLVFTSTVTVPVDQVVVLYVFTVQSCTQGNFKVVCRKGNDVISGVVFDHLYWFSNLFHFCFSNELTTQDY